MFRRLLVCVLILAACTGETTPTTSTSVAQTTAASSPPTTRLTMTDGGLVQADPATLVPYQDSATLVVGSWHDGVTSPDGRWAAVVSDLDLEGTNQINIIDLTGPSVVATTKGTGDAIYISDEGLAIWFDDGRLVGLTSDGQPREWGSAPTTNPALYESLTIFQDGRIAFLAGDGDSLQPVDITLIDDNEVELRRLEVLSGPADNTDPALPSVDWIAPDVAWDEPRSRAFVVSPFSNEVIEVDLDTPNQIVHDFESSHQPRFPDGSVGRDTYVSPDGTTLLIATRILEVEGTNEDWEARDYAGDIAIVDTSNWSSQSVTQSVWVLIPSPEKGHVAGMGSAITWNSAGDTERLDSPVYLFDGDSGQPLVGFEGRSGDIVDSGFAADGAYLYVTSQSGSSANIDVIDVASQELVGSLGFTGISLVEEASLIAFHGEAN